MLESRIGALEQKPGEPIYQQLQGLLRRAIEQGTLEPLEALPPERDIAQAYGISRVTVRKAIDGLVADQMLARRQGSGTYVAQRIEKTTLAITSFSEDMVSRGRVPSSRWLARTEALATSDEVMALGLSPGNSVMRFARIRFADGESMALEYSSIPADLLPSPGAVEHSLYEALGNHRPQRVLQRLRAILFNAEQLGLLGIGGPAAGLEIERRGFAADGRAVEFTRSYYRGDAYDYVSEVGGQA